MRRTAVIASTLALLPVVTGAAQSSARINGTVFDSVRHAPLRRALVIATPLADSHDTTFHSAQSDDQGRFAIAALPPGAYALSVEHPYLDSTGISALPVTLTARAGDNSATLGLPSAATLRRALCPAAVTDTTLGIMLGVVRSVDGKPTPNATVVFRWADFDLDRASLRVTSQQVGADVKSDSTGAYRACGLPRARSIFVQAQVDTTSQSGLVEEQIGEAGVLLRDFHVSGVGAAPLEVPAIERPQPRAGSAGTYLVTGRVLDAGGNAVSSAQVSLLGTGRTATTDARGQFRIGAAPGGTQGVEVLALGYSPRYLRAEVGDGMPPFEVRMERTAVLLDSMRVIARQNFAPANKAYAEFDQRAKTTQGVWMSEDFIKDKHPFSVSDLFKGGIPGVKLVRISNGSFPHYLVVSTQNLNGFYGACPLKIFIDEVPMDFDDIDRLPPEALHGAEVFDPATAPIKYNANRCGAVLLWTRR